ncbi:hypothetical protein GCK72_026048 [Caenorhabditis remanei]|uniref:Uncharacterized protein n=1 Tax=Caenorhabditis remanei TaxID=31234 RepID=A0A6A5G3T5_CAERE|nr:hypothetical protein GCK72_026048 [Caenorhabditis remanei]KAF1749580.1 hypothetical protein GCK72_026048 [Caenorhabditis remanei]
MADKSTFMSAAGNSFGYMGSNVSSSGYAHEQYASGGSGRGANNNQNQGSGGNTNPGQIVFINCATLDHRNIDNNVKKSQQPAKMQLFSVFIP